MNPKNGKMMAMANYPTYDPAAYAKVENGSVYNNNTTTMAYENGSVIKSFTMATGINEGVANANTRYYNTDSIKIEDITINNAALGHTGSITLQTAMNYSLNTGMVTIGKLLGGGSLNDTARNKIYDYFHNRFGFGRETGIEVLESKGSLVSPKDAEGNAVRYSNMIFGQGMATTMLQTANAFSSLVNGGTLYKPSLIEGIVDENGKLSKKEPEINKEAVISKETSEQMRQVLEGVRKVGGAKDPSGYQIGGKTGTSQTIVGGKYVDYQTIGSYVGFGGGDEAEYVIMVAVWGENQNLQGSKDAAPIFTEISNWLLNYLEIKPKN
jgi:cell division protein ftsI